ncbi:hypothetical protein Rt10032_c25g6783 [Rhodotorula toruloides]|uniref:Uncharacterized protein n=1 Tax=Rhodotorula toruloides TaxID=5286 RepID=A0A511KS91_RHOTO|nr:hypothetical protein Rt10032_c25g6783 [Rhodotorula toruloides]
MAGRKRSNSVKEALKQLEPTSPPDATTNKPAWTQPTGPLACDERQRYGKGPWDLAFLAFYIVVFSFLRQSVTEFSSALSPGVSG